MLVTLPNQAGVAAKVIANELLSAVRELAGVNAGPVGARPLMAILSKRQLPEVLFKSAPVAARQEPSVEALTIRMPKFALFVAPGSVMDALKLVNQSCPPIVPLTLVLSLT